MEYFILKPDGEQTGTYSIDQVRAMLNTGFIGPDARYWHEGIADWQPIDRIEESLNFPEPGPNEPHTAPPPPRKLSGSLARAIPSPHQQQKRQPSGTVAVAATTPDAPEMPAPRAEVPAPSRRIESPPVTGPAPLPEVVPGQVVPDTPPSPPPSGRPRRLPRLRRPRLTGAQWIAVALSLLTAAVVVAVVESRHPAKSPLSKVAIARANAYVLLDQAAIKSFEDEMRTSPVALSLQRQIAQSSDPVLLQKLNIGLQRETGRHAVETTQEYLRTGRAEVIEPGTYSAVAYFDDNGVLTPPRPGLPWVALTYRGNVVYAYLGSEFNLVPQ